MNEMKPDFLKYVDGLIPAIIQDADTNIVLMLGFMNKEALHKTRETKLVTFYSRTRKRLWTKGDVRKENPNEQSYTSSLFKKGINAVAQKVGEEAVELIIEAKDNDAEKFKNEAADLLFHYLVLLSAKGFTLDDIITILKLRHSK